MSTATFQQTPPAAMDQQYLCKRCDADLQSAAAAMHIQYNDLPFEVGWLASRSTGLACITHLTNQSRDRKMNAQRISQRTLIVAETLEVSICGDSGSFYFQSSSPPSSGGTYCMCIRFLSFWCMCIAHLNHSKPGKLGIIFRAPPSTSYSKRGEELAGEVTVLVLHECGVLRYYHNSESSLLNPLIQS